MASQPHTGVLAMDVAPPKRWRRFIPSWLRSLIWVDAAYAYDAFLSYSWRSDKEIAPVVQAVIHRFLCPWYKVRAKTVFRDLSCLPAGSSLEGELFARLDRSSNLIVLASPDAATSRGMELEARHWLNSDRKDGEVIIVVTAASSLNATGAVTWEEIRDYLLPPALQARFAETEPLWISIVNRRVDILANPGSETVRGQLIEDLKQIFLRLYPGSTWEELRGEERKQRRRAMGLMGGTALLFMMAAVLIFWEGWRALKMSEEATSNYTKAVDVATRTGDIVREQILPDGTDRPKSVTARSLLEVSRKTFDVLPSKYETPMAGLSRVKLFESLWNAYYILGDYSTASELANREFELAKRYQNSGNSGNDKPGDPTRADWLRYMCRARENLADDARVTNDPHGAEANFREALQLALQLSKAPGAEVWKNELPHAYERLGDALRDQAQFPEALTEFKHFLALQGPDDPRDPASLRNLAVVYGKVGDLSLQQGRLDDALAEFENNLKTSGKLAKMVPNNLDAQRGVAVAHERLGFVRREKGLYPEAFADYTQELAIAGSLGKRDGSNFQWARDEGLANEGLGDISRDSNRLTRASGYYQDYLKAILRAAERSPKNARIRREVAIAYERLGDISRRLGQKEQARKDFETCLTTSKGASTAFEPRNPEPRDVPGYCQAQIAELGESNRRVLSANAPAGNRTDIQ